MPFDQLIIFSTNLEPRDLVDEAFLRRIPYKIEVVDPTEDEFRQLFRIVCPRLGFEYDEAAVEHLIQTRTTSRSGGPYPQLPAARPAAASPQSLLLPRPAAEAHAGSVRLRRRELLLRAVSRTPDSSGRSRRQALGAIDQMQALDCGLRLTIQARMADTSWPWTSVKRNLRP